MTTEPHFVSSPRTEDEEDFDHEGPSDSERQPLYDVVQYGAPQAPTSLSGDGAAPNWSSHTESNTVEQRPSGVVPTIHAAPAGPAGKVGFGLPIGAHNSPYIAARSTVAATTACAGSRPLLSTTAGLGFGGAHTLSSFQNPTLAQALSLQSASLGSLQQPLQSAPLPLQGLAQKRSETSTQQALLLQQLMQLQATSEQLQRMLRQTLLPNTNAPVPGALGAESTTERAPIPVKSATVVSARVSSEDLDSEKVVDAAAANEKESPKTTRILLEKPKRPLSAYNLFFKDQRVQLINEVQKTTDKAGPPPRRNGKKRKLSIGFEEMARTIGARWKAIDSELRSYYKEKAAKDKDRYRSQLRLYNETKLNRLEAKRQRQEASVSAEVMKEYLESAGKKMKKAKNLP